MRNSSKSSFKLFGSLAPLLAHVKSPYNNLKVYRISSFRRQAMHGKINSKAWLCTFCLGVHKLFVYVWRSPNNYEEVCCMVLLTERTIIISLLLVFVCCSFSSINWHVVSHTISEYYMKSTNNLFGRVIAR